MGFKLKHTFPIGVHPLHCIGVLIIVIIQQQLLLYRCIVYVVGSYRNLHFPVTVSLTVSFCGNCFESIHHYVHLL